MLDGDASLRLVVVDRCRRLGWGLVELATDDLSRVHELRLSTIVVNPTAVPEFWGWLEQVARRSPEIVLVVCSAPVPVAERVRGLHLGADEWMTKPVHPDELVARIEAIMRRQREAIARTGTAPARAGELEIRADQFQALAGGQSAELTRREFELLQALAGASGKVLEREQLYWQVWGYRMARGERSVDVFVRKLRQKLERISPGWKYIHTHPGSGYRFKPEPRDAAAGAEDEPERLQGPSADDPAQ